MVAHLEMVWSLSDVVAGCPERRGCGWRLKTGPGAAALQYFFYARAMGNFESKSQQREALSQIEQLCEVTQRGANSPCCLGFNPFGCGGAAGLKERPGSAHLFYTDTSISSMIDEAEETDTNLAPPAPLKATACHLQQKSHQIQKNITRSQRVAKTKKIKKDSGAEQRGDRGRPAEAEEREEERRGEERKEEEGVGDENIRDQNNCKSYHKLLKNYLISKGHEELIQSYESKYHTRYYFIVALILIRQHITKDFFKIYQGIVEAEIQAQNKKISKKTSELAKLKERLLQLQQRQADPSEMLARRAKLEKQIEHIEVIKYEIGNYSVRSCAAFFQGNIEESLRVLYLKDDPVMRKKSYFESALQTVKQIASSEIKPTST